MAGGVHEVQWSDLQKDPKGVAELADAGTVRVRRRDGINLLLLREDRMTAAGAGAVIAARALRNLLTQLPPGALVDALTDEFPWLGLLPAQDAREFSAEFVRGALAAAELGQWEVLDRVVREWKQTASTHVTSTMD